MKVNQSGNNGTAAGVSQQKQVDKSSKAAKSSSANSNSGAASASGSESVKTNLSAKGKEMAQAKSVAMQSPDVREEKIAELKKRIAEGRYNVDPQKVADKMVDDHMSSAKAGLS